MDDARAARPWILGFALLQGLALWALTTDALKSLQPAVSWPLLLLALAVPTTLQLLADRRADRRLWALAAGLGLLLAAASASIGYQSTPGMRAGAGVTVVVLLGACWFVLLPFVAQRLERGHWARDYEHLFATAWRHTFQLQAATLFTLLFWALLMLLAGLFSVLGIKVFATLFRQAGFIAVATPLAFGLGLSFYAARGEALAGFWRALLGMLAGLLPLACLIALLFLLALPVQGLAPLWKTGHATALMLGLVAWVVFLFNVAWSDGRSGPRFGTALRRFVGLGLLALPVYAGLSAYAVGLRVGQYGWSVDRVWAALAVAVLSVHAVGYAVAVLRRDTPWMAFARRVNVAAALLAVLLALLSCTPLLSPARIAVASQVARLAHQRVDAATFDFNYLARSAGRAGRDALERLRNEQAHPQAALVRERAARALQADGRSPRDSTAAPAEWTDANLRARLLAHPQGAALDPGWVAALLELARSRKFTPVCSEARPCGVIAVDLDGDGQPEQVLLQKGTGNVFSRGQADGTWRHAGWLLIQPTNRQPLDAQEAALQHQDWSAEPPRWKDLRIGGNRYSVRPAD